MLRGPALLLVSLLVTACPRERPVVVERACDSACAGLLASTATPSSREGCLTRCSRETSLARGADCGREYEAFLTCLSRSSSALEMAGDALSLGAGVLSCAQTYGVYARCAEACREHGVVRSGARTLRDGAREVLVQAEVTTRGCGRDFATNPHGAPAGSRCEHHTVCEPVTCPCKASSEGYRVRACIDQACATPDAACRLAPQAVEHEVCRP